ncbi:MAG: hypothetical protein ACLVJO_02705 [[Clostridium] scindens]
MKARKGVDAMLKAGEYKADRSRIIRERHDRRPAKAKELGVSHILLVCDDQREKTGLDARTAKILRRQRGDTVKRRGPTAR